MKHNYYGEKVRMSDYPDETTWFDHVFAISVMVLAGIGLVTVLVLIGWVVIHIK